MPSIRNRNGKWQVQVRRNGLANLSRTFSKKRDAEVWARDAEAQIDRGEIPWAQFRNSKQTLGDLLRRYQGEVTPQKRGASFENYRLAQILRQKLSGITLADLSSSDIAKYRDERLNQVSPDTIRKELVLIRHAIEIARREWDLRLPENPVDMVRKPAPSPPRERRVSTEKLLALRAELSNTRNPHLGPVVEFAIETAMRRGEILSLKFDLIDLEMRVASLSVTKNGLPRSVPLTARALEVVQFQREKITELSEVFPITGNALRLGWTRLCKRAGIEDLHFHDLRHEAISRFFELG